MSQLLRLAVPLALATAAAILVIAQACAGGSGEESSDRTDGPPTESALKPDATAVAATITAGGPTAIAEATRTAADSAPSSPASASATAEAATVIAGGPTAIAHATAQAASGATPTPPAALRLRIDMAERVRVGDAIEVTVQLEGAPRDIAAFNFDIVYDERLVELDAPEPAFDLLSTDEREFQCNLPPASGDVDPDPNVGRARLVCFSFGGAEAPAPRSPATLARTTVRGVSEGEATLRFENVAVFTPDARSVIVAPGSATIVVE